MITTEELTALRKFRAKILAKTDPFDLIFKPDPNRPTIARINDGTYDWTKLPRWVNSIPVTAYHLRQRKTIIERLCEDPVGDWDAAIIGLDMLECSKTYPCGSPFCPYCRHKVQENRSKTALTKFAATAKSEMTFLTILHPVTYDPFHDAQGHIDQLRNSVRNALNFRGFNQVRMLGAFEIDVKRREDARAFRSKQVLTALGMDTTWHKPAYLVHLHSLVDLGGHSRKEVRRVFTGVFDKPYQVRLTYLHRDKGKDESIDRVARYMSKFRTQFSDNLYGKERGLKVQYRELYPAPLMREYVKLIHSIKIDNGFKGLRFKYH